MEVMLMPSPADAGSTTCTSQGSPQGDSASNYFFNAPTYSSVFHRQISFSTTGCDTPLPQNHQNNFEDDEYDSITTDFAFDFSGQLDPAPSLSAEELFDGGKIKPLEPPKRILKNSNEKTIIETRRDSTLLEGKDIDQRGRERVYESSNSRRRQFYLSKSLSPLRNSNMISERISNARISKQISPSLITSSSSCSSWYGKWKLTDLLLFRSVSEGHATNKRYKFFKKISQNEDVKNSRFRSTDSSGLGSSSGRRKNGNVSAHEWHYKVNRAVAEEMRRKTFLQDLLRNRLNVDDFEVEEEPRTDFPCPYCYEDFDIASLCSHLEDEHSGESRITVCPICAVKVARDMLSHITLQHGHLFKLHRRRRLRRVAMPYSQTPSILGRDLRDAHLQLLLGGVGHRSSSATSSNAIIDPLLSSLVLNFPASEAEEISKAVVSCAEDLSTKSVTSQHIWKSSFDPSSSIEEREKRLRQAAGKAAFMQDLFFSTLLSE